MAARCQNGSCDAGQSQRITIKENKNNNEKGALWLLFFRSLLPCRETAISVLGTVSCARNLSISSIAYLSGEWPVG